MSPQDIRHAGAGNGGGVPEGVALADPVSLFVESADSLMARGQLATKAAKGGGGVIAVVGEQQRPLRQPVEIGR